MDAQQLTSDEYKLLRKLRHHLHQHPEVSHRETNTAVDLADWAREHLPSFERQENSGDNGFLLVYHSGNSGPRVMFRAELDALPITENNPDIGYKSSNEGVAHVCGHDGHMAMLCGLGLLAERHLPEKGALALLFQPAEETGEGAAIVTEGKPFNDFKPDVVYALHNLPGEPLGQILIKPGSMCLASTGLWLHLSGKTSHAAHPFAGNSPLRVFEPLLPHLQYEKTSPLRISTLVHVQLGEPAFGTTPGNMSLALTIRAEADEQLDELERDIVGRCQELAKTFDIALSTERTEHFSAVINNEQAVDTICRAAETLHLSTKMMHEPMRWSEDVGVLLNASSGALLCIGSGTDTPVLHHPTYDFPDKLIPIGSALFHRILVNTIEEHS